MGRGSSKAGGGGGNPQTAQREQIVTDDYGRQVVVVPDASQIPTDRDIWASGAFTKGNDNYVVFGRINGYSVDTSSLMGVKVSQSDYQAIKGVAGWRSWNNSADADRYVKRYDKPSSSALTKRYVARAKAFSTTMKKFGR